MPTENVIWFYMERLKRNDISPGVRIAYERAVEHLITGAEHECLEFVPKYRAEFEAYKLIRRLSEPQNEKIQGHS